MAYIVAFGESEMGFRVSIDKFGRIVIPAQVRKKLGIKAGSELIVELRGSTIVIRPMRDIDEVVDKWFEKMVSMKVEARHFRISGGKWLSDEYVRRKLGLD